MPYLLRGQHWEQALDILMFAQRSNLQRKSGTAGAGAFFNVEHQLELYNVSISACQKWLRLRNPIWAPKQQLVVGLFFRESHDVYRNIWASGIVFAAVIFFNGSSSKFQHSSVCGERNVFLGGVMA